VRAGPALRMATAASADGGPAAASRSTARGPTSVRRATAASRAPVRPPARSAISESISFEEETLIANVRINVADQRSGKSVARLLVARG
jgi:hypothetical protein